MVSYKIPSTIASFNAWNQVYLEFSGKFLGTRNTDFYFWAATFLLRIGYPFLDRKIFISIPQESEF